jgi:hypothetical protein
VFVKTHGVETPGVETPGVETPGSSGTVKKRRQTARGSCGTSAHHHIGRSRKQSTVGIFAMISRRNALMVTLAALLSGAAPALATGKSGPVARLDTDNDGTVDLEEAKKAAGALFDKLDTDKDGTLDLKELKGRVTPREFRAADPDNDGTLSKDEYLALVEKRFKAADPDNDGTVSAAEFKTRAGRALRRLLY